MTSDAQKWRLKQALKLLKVFKEAHGRDATDVDELTAWVRSPEGDAALTPHRDAKGKIIPDEQAA